MKEQDKNALVLGLMQKAFDALGLKDDPKTAMPQIQAYHTSKMFSGYERDEIGRLKVKRVNLYVSEDYEIAILVRDIHQGVTPAFILDPETKDFRLRSTMYLIPQTDELFEKAEYEFYRPTFQVAAKMSKPLRDHYNQGGLILRKVGEVDKEPLKAKL